MHVLPCRLGRWAESQVQQPSGTLYWQACRWALHYKHTHTRPCTRRLPSMAWLVLLCVNVTVPVLVLVRAIVSTLLVWLTRHLWRPILLFFYGNAVGEQRSEERAEASWLCCNKQSGSADSECIQGEVLKPCQRQTHIFCGRYFWFDIEMPFSYTRRHAHPKEIGQWVRFYLYYFAPELG